MMSRKVNAKLNVTKNYRLFTRSHDNRELNPKKHKKLFASMQKYGFLPSFPLSCARNGNSHLIVKDGQHRLAFAEELGLPVYWVEDSTDFDISLVNCTPKTWSLRDHAEKHAAHGIQPYVEGLDFAERHHLPIGTAFSLLGGTTTYSNIQEAFTTGTFTVKDRDWAECVGAVYSSLCEMASVLRNVRFIEACMACARVDGFDPSRLIKCAKMCRDKLVSYSTRDAFLDMLEYVYNFKRQKTVPLKFLAIQAMRERNAVKAKT